MNFKRAGGKIFGVTFNKAEQAAMDAEVARQVVEMDKQYELDRESSILWMLHDVFGFGPKRLFTAFKMMYESGERLRRYYEMGRDDKGWLCRHKLKELGVNLEEWYNNENNNSSE